MTIPDSSILGDEGSWTWMYSGFPSEYGDVQWWPGNIGFFSVVLVVNPFFLKIKGILLDRHVSRFFSPKMKINILINI